MIKSADVVIIGGGIIGCCVAYYLSKEGVKVILIEKDYLGSGASGSNQGATAFHRTLDVTRELSLMSLQMYQNVVDKLEFDIEFEEINYCISSLKDFDNTLINIYKKMKEKGVMCNLLSKSEIEENIYLPFGSNYTIKSMIEILKGCFLVNPFKVVFGFAQAAVKNGAMIYQKTEVKGINVKNGCIDTVITTKGIIKTKYIVNAAGAWSSNIGKMVGINIPVKAQKGQVIVTEPTDIKNSYRYFLDVEYLKNEDHYTKGINNLSEREKLGIGMSVGQSKSGNWIIGSSHEFIGFDKKVTIKEIQFIVKCAMQFFPSMSLLSCIRTFAGIRPFCYVDGYPIIGKTNKIKGFVIATGHGGLGVKLGPITGKIITQIILKGESKILPTELNYKRFSMI